MFVSGHTIANPVCLLNRSLLITNAGLRPFCSRPDCGSKNSVMKSHLPLLLADARPEVNLRSFEPLRNARDQLGEIVLGAARLFD